jgi:transcriptional regulator with XRE-family HTH domain
MNGGLYPSEEIDKSFESLNRTPVTVEHPEIDGVFVSASDPEIDFDFRFGAFNENARKMPDGRIALDKVINVQKALMTEKGKRLLDRIDELENNAKARPIHTSVGVFLDVEETELATNEHGQDFTWIARDMVFDHDAILLDSIGASTPDQGTGIGINKERLKVSHFVMDDQREVKALNYLTNELSFSEIEHELFKELNKGLNEKFSFPIAVFDDSFIFETSEGELFRSNYTVDELNNVSIQDTRLPVERVVEFRPINTIKADEGLAMKEEIIEALKSLGITINGALADRLNSLLESESDDSGERSDLIDRMASAGGIARDTMLAILAGDIDTPPDERLRGFAEVLGVSFDSLKSLVSNSQNGDSAMRDSIIAELAKLGITVNAEISDAELKVELNKALTANKGDDTQTKDIAEIVANAVKDAVTPLTTKIDSLETKLQENSDNELTELADFIVNSKQRPEFTADQIKGLGIDTAKSIAANCGFSQGIGSTMQVNNHESDTFKTNVDDLPD